MSEGRLSARWFPWLFALFMGGVMTALVTLALTLVYDPWRWAAVGRWLQRWALAWSIATPTIHLLAPRMRRLATRFAIPPTA